MNQFKKKYNDIGDSKPLQVSQATQNTQPSLIQSANRPA